MEIPSTFRWFARPTFSMLSGEPELYKRYSDGLLLEAGHLLLRWKYLLRSFGTRIRLVDPRTPAFQTDPRQTIDPRTNRVRSSYLRLASKHGGPIWKRFSRQAPILPRHLPKGACSAIAMNMLDLQRSAGTEILLPPYFAFSSMDDEWLSVNARIYDAMAHIGGSQVYFPLAFDHRMLRTPGELTDWAASLRAGGYALWPIGLDEFRADVETLVGLSHLLTALPGSVVMLYSGPFSVFLCAMSRASFSCGPCFYEARGLKIAPRLEFRPRCRYRLRELYQKVDPVAAVVYYRLLEELGQPPNLCPACTRNTNGGGYDGLAAMPDLDIFEHNFRTKRQEMETFRHSGNPARCFSMRLENLLRNQEEFSRFRHLGFAATWLQAISCIA